MSDIRNGAFVYLWLGGRYVRTGFWECEEDRAFATRSRFQYESEYLRMPNAIPLDPASLPLGRSRVIASEASRPLFGIFNDLLPSSWGQRVLYEIAVESGLGDPSCFDMIVAGGRNSIGAVAFGLPDGQGPKWDYPLSMEGPHLADGDLETLMLAAEYFEEKKFQDMPPVFKSFLGTSVQTVGGARPKSLLNINGVPTVAKFKLKGDTWNVCTIENATMRFARGMEIRVPETSIRRIKKRDVFLIERFDRIAGESKHLATAASLIKAKYAKMASASVKYSYTHLVDAISVFGSPGFIQQDREELFRRVVYNILMANEDDHLKNHTFLFDGNGWRLAPLYDVVPSENPVRHLCLGVSETGRTLMTLGNALAAHAVFGLERRRAEEIVEFMTDRFLSSWEKFFNANGVSKKDVALLKKRLGPKVDHRIDLESDPWVLNKFMTRR
jgi:serine/threonine-protein kinase HipA